MLRRIILVLLTAMSVFSIGMRAQTPVEDLIMKYEDVAGAKDFIAQGGAKLALAKNVLRRTPVASLAPDVTEVAVLKMANASSGAKQDFVGDLRKALATYEYHGTHHSSKGNVEVYILMAGKNQADELIIYNPQIYSLNLLHGSFTVESLLELQ